VVEAASKHLAHTFGRVDEVNDKSSLDLLTELPTVTDLNHFLDSINPESLDSIPVTLLHVDIVNMKHVNNQHGRNGGDEILRAVGRRIRECLGTNGRLFRPGADEFIAIIGGTTRDASDVASKIRDIVCQRPFALHNNVVLHVDVDVRTIQIPLGTTSVREFVATQLSMMPPQADGHGRHIH
jgi:diguanylate cyclase (GGDEF)-like protein